MTARLLFAVPVAAALLALLLVALDRWARLLDLADQAVDPAVNLHGTPARSASSLTPQVPGGAERGAVAVSKAGVAPTRIPSTRTTGPTAAASTLHNDESPASDRRAPSNTVPR